MSKQCKHYWSYVHVVYQGDVIRRWCEDCGREEHAVAGPWKQTSTGRFEQSAPEAFRSLTYPKQQDTEPVAIVKPKKAVPAAKEKSDGQ